MPVPPLNTPGQLSGSMHLSKEKENKRKHNQRKTAQGFFGARGCGICQKFFPLKVIFKASVYTHPS